MSDESGLPTRSRRPRFIILLAICFAAGLLAEPHGDYSRTAFGVFSTLILAIVPALPVSFVVWLCIRKGDPRSFAIVSVPVGSAIIAVGAFFVYLMKGHAERAGIEGADAYIRAVQSSAGLVMLAGAATILAIRMKSRESTDDNA
jgi:membrane protease YdiL (CAAX protease family)